MGLPVDENDSSDSTLIQILRTSLGGSSYYSARRHLFLVSCAVSVDQHFGRIYQIL